MEAKTEYLSRDGKHYLKFIGVTEDFAKGKELEDIAKYSVNQPIIYRHVHPSSPAEGEILGQVISSKIVDHNGKKAVELEAELMDHTEFQNHVIKYISSLEEKGEHIGISIGKQSFVDKDGKVVAGRPFEYSLTDIPACKDCGVVTAIMEDDVEKIKAKLDEVVKLNEELKSKIELYEEEKKAITEKYEAEKQDVVEKLTKRLELMEEELKQAKRAPLLAKLQKLEQDTMLVEEVYAKMDNEWLEKRIKFLEEKKPVKPYTERFEERGKKFNKDDLKALAEKYGVGDYV